MTKWKKKDEKNILLNKVHANTENKIKLQTNLIFNFLFRVGTSFRILSHFELFLYSPIPLSSVFTFQFVRIKFVRLEIAMKSNDTSDSNVLSSSFCIHFFVCSNSEARNQRSRWSIFLRITEKGANFFFAFEIVTKKTMWIFCALKSTDVMNALLDCVFFGNAKHTRIVIQKTGVDFFSVGKNARQKTT